MDYMLEHPDARIPDPPRDDDLEPDEYSDEDADRAEDRWIAERDNLYR